jgi:hypothetical protein
MTPNQILEIQNAVERMAFELHDVQSRVLHLEVSARHEDTRKRIFRTIVIMGIAAVLAMQWWGFSEILTRLGGG